MFYFFGHVHLLIELGEQIIAFADVSSGGDGELEDPDGQIVLQIIVQQLRKLLQESDQICVMLNIVILAVPYFSLRSVLV